MRAVDNAAVIAAPYAVSPWRRHAKTGRMTVFISHAAADAEVAQGLEKFLERRGQFVEADDGETALRPLQNTDVLALLISQNLVMSIYRLRLEQRALDAWAEGRLVLI